MIDGWEVVSLGFGLAMVGILYVKQPENFY